MGIGLLPLSGCHEQCCCEHMCMRFCVSMCSFFSGVYGVLGHVVTLFNALRSCLSSAWWKEDCAPCYVSHSHQQGVSLLIFRYPWQRLFDVSPCGREVVPRCGFDLRFLMTSDTEHISMCSSAICRSLQKCLFRRIACILVGYLVFLCHCWVCVLYVCRISDILQIFSTVLLVALSFSWWCSLKYKSFEFWWNPTFNYFLGCLCFRIYGHI